MKKDKDKQETIGIKLFNSMASRSGIDLEKLNSQDWPCFTSQFNEDPKPRPVDKKESFNER